VQASGSSAGGRTNENFRVSSFLVRLAANYDLLVRVRSISIILRSESVEVRHVLSSMRALQCDYVVRGRFSSKSLNLSLIYAAH